MISFGCVERDQSVQRRRGSRKNERNAFFFETKKKNFVSPATSSSSSKKKLPQASSLASALGLPSVAALLPKIVASASRAARVPTSRYRVGAAALGASGRVFVGANLELPRAPLAGSVHAEQFVVALAAQRGERGLRRVAVSAPPCGHCRQFCCELNCADELEFEFGDEGGEEDREGVAGERTTTAEDRANGAKGGASPSSSVATLRALLPRHFGPHDLAKDSGTKPKLLLDDSGVSLELTPRSLAAVAAATATAEGATAAAGKEEEERGGASSFPASALVAAAEAALCAARGSHTPHTRCPAGVALVWRSRTRRRGGDDDEEKTASSPSSPSPNFRVSAGGAIESAAYNPSLPPLQAALVAAVADGMPPYDDRSRAAPPTKRGQSLPSSSSPSSSSVEVAEVLGAVLVERPRARVSHAAATRAALAALSLAPRGGASGGSAAAASRSAPPSPPLVVLHARGPARAPGEAEGESGYESGSEEEEESEEEEGP